MDRFWFRGHGQHISCEPLCFPLNSFSFYQLDAGDKHRGSTSSFIFYLVDNNPVRDPVPSRKGSARRERGRAEGDGETAEEMEKWRDRGKKEWGIQRGRKVSASTADTEKKKKREKEMENRVGKGERKRKQLWLAFFFFFTNFFVPIAISGSCCNFCPNVKYRWLSERSISTLIPICVFFLSAHSNIESLSSLEWYYLLYTHLIYFSPHSFMISPLYLAAWWQLSYGLHLVGECQQTDSILQRICI